jgi:hypothetical protein
MEWAEGSDSGTRARQQDTNNVQRHNDVLRMPLQARMMLLRLLTTTAMVTRTSKSGHRSSPCIRRFIAADTLGNAMYSVLCSDRLQNPFLQCRLATVVLIACFLTVVCGSCLQPPGYDLLLATWVPFQSRLFISPQARRCSSTLSHHVRLAAAVEGFTFPPERYHILSR